MQGAATKPTKSPIVSAPTRPRLRARAVRDEVRDADLEEAEHRKGEGGDRGAMPTRTAGFWSQTPKSEPESAAKTPSAEYVTLIPRT